MRFNHRLVAGAAGLAIGLAACGGTSSSPSASGDVAGASGTPAIELPSTSPSMLPSMEPSTSPAASMAPSFEPSAAPSFEPSAAPPGSASSSPGASSPASTSDLVALLPDDANGITFVKRSVDGQSLGEGMLNFNSTELDRVLSNVGASRDDVHAAFAMPADPMSGETATVIAVRIDGTTADQIIGVTGVDVSGRTPTTVAGKSVYVVGSDGLSAYVYPKDDVLYEVLLASPTTAEAVLQQLP